MAPTQKPLRPSARRGAGTLAGLLGALLIVSAAAACGASEGELEAPSGAESAPPEPESPSAPAASPADPTAGLPAPEHARKLFGYEARITPAPGGTRPDAPATLKGVTRILGKVPKPQVIAMDHIAGCREHGGATTETVLAKETGEVQNAVVYVARGVDAEAVDPAPEEPVVMVQAGCVFRPHVVVLRTGQTLQIENADQTGHNVHSRPAHASNKAFNHTQPRGAAALEVSFPRAEVAIPLGCDVHPWMKAWVAVVDHPYWALSDEDGAWSIEVPPGDYLVEAWHERYGTLKGTVEVAAGEVAEFDFTFETAKGHR